MGDEILGALENPRQIAHTELVGIEQDGGQDEPGGVRQSLRLPGDLRGGDAIEASAAQALRCLEVQAKQIAAVVGHRRSC